MKGAEPMDSVRSVGWSAFLLVLLSCAWNIGQHHLFVHTDEPRRTLVALEMLISHDYLNPTLLGETYLNKPPLYNWLVLGSYQLWGSLSEAASRFPTLVFMGLLGLSVYGLNRRLMSQTVSLLAALIVLTNSRLLFYDSFLGMIDLPFAWITWLQIMSIFLAGERQRWGMMYALSYALAAIGFLLKGLPSLAFQGLTLVTYAFFFQNKRMLAKREHLAGIALFMLLLAAYYGPYLRQLNVPWQLWLENLIAESSKRTALRFGPGNTLRHILVFPFDTLINFCPWSLAMFGLLHRTIRQSLWNNRYTRFCMLAGLVNLGVYWTSPEVTPRYLHMFVALIAPVWASILVVGLERGLPLFRFLRGFFLALCALLLVASLLLPYVNVGGHQASGLHAIALVFALGLTTTAWGLSQQKGVPFWFWLALFLAGIRGVYAEYLLPTRGHERMILRTEAIEIGRRTLGQPLYLLGGAWLQDGSSFYISRARGAILRKTLFPVNAPAFYLVENATFEKCGVPSLGQIHTLFRDDALQLIYLNPSDTREESQTCSFPLSSHSLMKQKMFHF